MKILTVLLLSFILAMNSYADLYVTIDGTDPKGTTSVKDEYLPDWEKDYTMIKVGEEFRGKHHYEIKYDGVNVRLATQQEIDAFLQQEIDKKEQAEIQRWLDKLDNPDIKQKIKNL